MHLRNQPRQRESNS